MIRSLGTEEVESILAERGEVEVGCDFCGEQYHYDAVDAAQIFTGAPTPPPAPSSLQ
jgi:molecular chaperone Hsp33